MRELITTSLDLVGLLLLVAALSVLIWPYTVPGALAAAGVGLLAVRWLVDRVAGPSVQPEEGGGV